MALDCWEWSLASMKRRSSAYVIQKGDTLVAIAKRFGLLSWKDIYYYPENAPFRKKRPNPDKIFPGDQCLIPGGGVRTLETLDRGDDEPRDPLAPLSLRLQSSFLGIKEKDDGKRLDYLEPGSKKIRIALFWVTNCLHIESCAKKLVDKAEALFAARGLDLDVYPGTTRLSTHTIKFDDLLVTDEDKNSIREASDALFDEKKHTRDKKKRLRIFLCEWKDTSNGLTRAGGYDPHCLVSGNLTPDKATLAHEIVHAAGIMGHERDPKNKDNILSPLTDNRSEFFKSQVQKVASSFFVV